MNDTDLRVWRAKHKLSQSFAALILGVSQITISRWENGRWPRDLAERVAQAEKRLRAARSQPASASRKVDARTQAKYDAIKAELASRGRTVPQWHEGQLRDKLLSAADRAHADKMLELFNAEKGE